MRTVRVATGGNVMEELHWHELLAVADHIWHWPDDRYMRSQMDNAAPRMAADQFLAHVHKLLHFSICGLIILSKCRATHFPWETILQFPPHQLFLNILPMATYSPHYPHQCSNKTGFFVSAKYEYLAAEKFWMFVFVRIFGFGRVFRVLAKYLVFWPKIWSI